MLRSIHMFIYTKTAAEGGHRYIHTPLVFLPQNNPDLVQAVFLPFEIVDERNRDVFVVKDVKVVVGGEFREDLLLVLGQAFERDVGPPTLGDVGEALSNPLEQLREHDRTGHWLSWFFILAR